MPSYDTRFAPPAPLLDVQIVNPHQPAQFTFHPALLDTAADITAIPRAVAHELYLQSIRTISVAGVDGLFVHHPSYIVTLVVADTTFDRMQAIEWLGEEVLLGRDVLNEFEIKLDGKIWQFEIRDP